MMGLPAIPTHDGVPMRDPLPSDAPAPGRNLAPLWPKPGQTVWYRAVQATKWSVGVCIELTATGVWIRQIGGSGQKYLIFRDRHGGEQAILPQSPPPHLWSGSAVEAMRSRTS